MIKLLTLAFGGARALEPNRPWRRDYPIIVSVLALAAGLAITTLAGR